MEKAVRVMFVDDETTFLETTAKVFRRRGFTVDVCSAGRDVIPLLQEKNSQVVVLDLKMPGMGGEEVLRNIKSVLPDVQVIMLTGHASSEDAALCLTSGAFDFLIKPVEITELLDRVLRAADAWTLAAGHHGEGPYGERDHA